MTAQIVFNNERHCKTTKQVFIGSFITGVTGAIILQPLDVIKTHLQSKPILYKTANVGVVQTAYSLWQSALHSTRNRHGKLEVVPFLRVFWAGSVPSVMRCGTGIALYFSTMNLLQETVSYLHLEPRHLGSFLLGFTCRCLTTICLFPATLLKQFAEAGLTGGRSIFANLRHIHNHAKLAGLFSGLPATLLRDSPYSGLYFMIYSHLNYRVHISGIVIEPPMKTLLCASVASILATTMSHPADVIRATRQLRLAESLQASSRVAYHIGGFVDIAKDLSRADGFSGLWRGLSLRLLRRAAFACLTWSLFESL